MKRKTTEMLITTRQSEEENTKTKIRNIHIIKEKMFLFDRIFFTTVIFY